MVYILAAHYSRITLKCSLVLFPVMGRNDIVLMMLLFPPFGVGLASISWTA